MSNGASRNDVPRAEEHHAPSNPKSIFKQSSTTVSTVAYLEVWNTKKLYARIASDAVSAASAAALIAPLITIFDR